MERFDKNVMKRCNGNNNLDVELFLFLLESSHYFLRDIKILRKYFNEYEAVQKSLSERWRSGTRCFFQLASPFGGTQTNL